MSDVRLIVAGTSYGGWKNVDITRGLPQIAGSFTVGASELWPDQLAPRKITQDDRCEVKIEDETVATGWVDDITPSYDIRNHGVSIRGRDATGDLVDCSAIHETGEWHDRTLLQVATDLAKPFGIQVKADTDVGAPFARWKIHEGETVFENLDRMARHRGVLLVSDGKGALLITRAGTSRVATALERGKNIKSAEASLSFTNRYSKYIVKGQRPDGDLDLGGETTQKQAVAIDARIKRYRPLVVIAEDMADAATLEERAAWERNVRAGQSSRAVITVQGWKHKDGLWKPNTLVTVRDPWLRLDDRTLLLEQVRYVLDRDGTRAELSLTLPGAYDLIAIPEPAEEDLF